MLNTEDIKKLAGLSRIQIKEEELESLAHDMDSILGYVAELSTVSSSEQVVLTPTLKNIMREDIITNPRGEYTERILSSAPKKDGQFVKVKKILE